MAKPEVKETTTYYNDLELPTSATSDDIRKAYKRLARLTHPDKARTENDATANFERIRKAYDVLSDPKKRQIYDKYGDAGLSTYNQMGDMGMYFDPEVLPGAKYLVMCVSVVIGLVILFPCLLAAQIDTGFSYYTIVFIPLFLLDLIVLIPLVLTSFKYPQHEDEPSRQKERVLWYLNRLFMILYCSLIVAFQVLLCLRLDSFLSISYWGVFAPLLVVEVFNFLLILIPTVIQCRESVFKFSTESGNTENTHLNALGIVFLFISNYLLWSIRITQVILIFANVTNSLSANWAIIFIPTWTMGLFEILSISNAFFATDKGPASLRLLAFVVWGTLFYTTIGLLVKRLNSSDDNPHAAIILIPLFIILGIFLCCSTCVLPIAFQSEPHTFDEEIGGMKFVPANHRILDRVRDENKERSGCNIQ